jgi:hypothetical protein
VSTFSCYIIGPWDTRCECHFMLSIDMDTTAVIAGLWVPFNATFIDQNSAAIAVCDMLSWWVACHVTSLDLIIHTMSAIVCFINWPSNTAAGVHHRYVVLWVPFCVASIGLEM